VIKGVECAVGWCVWDKKRVILRGVSFDLDFCGAKDFVLESEALAKDAGYLLIFVGVWGVDFLESAVGGGVKQIAMDVDGFESLFFEGGE